MRYRQCMCDSLVPSSKHASSRTFWVGEGMNTAKITERMRYSGVVDDGLVMVVSLFEYMMPVQCGCVGGGIRALDCMLLWVLVTGALLTCSATYNKGQRPRKPSLP
eukprot:scaffold17919_cov22-Tisochrysis_lutea.AAC.2